MTDIIPAFRGEQTFMPTSFLEIVELPDGRIELRRAEDDKTREVGIDGPEAICRPRAKARPAECLLTGVHLQARAVVVDVVRQHRAD